MNLKRMHHAAGLSAMALSVTLLQACGGSGGNTAGLNIPGITPTVSGTVTGFGSVIVDGQELEDAYARIAHENADGSLTNEVLQMGQRVRVDHDGSGKASQVLIDAAVIGLVSTKGVNTLKVAGQVVTVNTDSTLGPVTVFGGGYTNLSSVALNDLVQVHGSPVYDSTSNSYKVQATRIQKDLGAARVQVNGKVTGYALTSTGASFALNGLTVNTTSTTAVRPSGTSLANDLQVTVYGNGLSGNVLTAQNIRVNRDQNSGNTTMQAQLSGAVSNYVASTGTFEVQGTRVKLGTATVEPAGASVANNAYVMLKGSVASDGSITATQIKVRTADTANDLAKVELIGVISDFVDSAHFMVRGVPVDASSVVFATACPSVTPANDLSVRVLATQQSGTAVVKATRIECKPTLKTQLIRPLDGTVAMVDAAGKSFSLTVGSTAQSVQWTDSTTFVGLTADTLSGKSVRVEGYLSGTVLMARVVRLDDDVATADARNPELDDKQFRRPRQSKDQAQGWQQYGLN